MKKASLIGGFMLASFLLLVIAAAPANALEIGARAYVWFPQYAGDLKIDGATLAGTMIDGKDDLGLGREIFPAAEIYAGIGKHHLSLAYTHMYNSGKKTLAQDIFFNGTLYANGTSLKTDLKSRILDLEYQYDVVNLENFLAGFSLGLIGKIKYLDCEAKLLNRTSGEKASENIRYPIPMIGLGAHIGLLANILEARAKVTGIGYSSDNLIYEAMADLSVTPFPFLDIYGGYRFMKMKVDRHDVFMDSEFSGPYVGLSIGF